ncbi:hypothetical protein M0R45_026149 [Rubus argutus]|uniref:Uncharacterized protein n=1 Tax=Rubus argutus TaxID=59490 RepID=A0AAW1WYZ8_RUBAR
MNHHSHIAHDVAIRHRVLLCRQLRRRQPASLLFPLLSLALDPSSAIPRRDTLSASLPRRHRSILPSSLMPPSSPDHGIIKPSHQTPSPPFNLTPQQSSALILSPPLFD